MLSQRLNQPNLPQVNFTYTASPTARALYDPGVALRVTDGGARVGRARETSQTYPSPASRDFVPRRRSRKHPRWAQSATFGPYSVYGDARRMTEGEGRPVAMKDDDSTSPSPADAPPLSALQTAR